MVELSKGQFWHLTDNPDFKLDPSHVPEDNAIAINERSRPGLFTGDPEHWINGHGYARPYVAEIHAPTEVAQDERWGGEKFIPAEHFDKAEVKRVIPTDAYARERYGEHGWIEEHHGTTFDMGAIIPPRHLSGNVPPQKGYKYDGPDARQMDEATRQHHADRVKTFLESSHG